MAIAVSWANAETASPVDVSGGQVATGCGPAGSLPAGARRDMSPAAPRRLPARRFARVLTVLAAAVLVAALVLVGLLACMAPPTTCLLAQATSLDDLSPYTRAELVELAVVTRDYTLGAASEEVLLRAEAAALAAAIEDGCVGASAVPLSPERLRSASPADLAAAFAETSDRYVLSRDALSHLDDCRSVITVASRAAVVAVLLTAVLLLACGRVGGRRLLGGAFLGAGAFVLLSLAVLAAWALLDFQGFFAVFHSLFFAQGSWVFPWNSLLICLYPDAFWTGMATVWVATSGLASAACVAVGCVARGRQ